MTEPEAQQQPDVWKQRLRKAVGPVFGLLVVAAIFIAILPQITSYQAVWDAAVGLGKLADGFVEVAEEAAFADRKADDVALLA